MYAHKHLFVWLTSALTVLQPNLAAYASLYKITFFKAFILFTCTFEHECCTEQGALPLWTLFLAAFGLSTVSNIFNSYKRSKDMMFTYLWVVTPALHIPVTTTGANSCSSSAVCAKYHLKAAWNFLEQACLLHSTCYQNINDFSHTAVAMNCWSVYKITNANVCIDGYILGVIHSFCCAMCICANAFIDQA